MKGRSPVTNTKTESRPTTVCTRISFTGWRITCKAGIRTTSQTANRRRVSPGGGNAPEHAGFAPVSFPASVRPDGRIPEAFFRGSRWAPSPLRVPSRDAMGRDRNRRVLVNVNLLSFNIVH